MDNLLNNAPQFAYVTLVAIFLFFLLTEAPVSGDVSALKRQAIERGYALHCPHDGAFAWKGECEELE